MEIEFNGYPTFERIAVEDLTQPGEARRAAAAIANRLGFDEVTRGKVEIVVTELSRNVAVHGGGGYVILAGWKYRGEKRIDVLALDKGSGIANVAAAMEDGYSSSGTPGTGLGAVSRIASAFQIFTQPKTGTALLARVSADMTTMSPLTVGAVSIPIAGERLCGDAFATAHSSTRSVFMVVDGLGHGPIAAEAAGVAVQTFEKYCGDAPAEIVSRLHDALKATRGAAAAVAEIEHGRDTLVFCGVGNISGIVQMPDEGIARSMVSHNGIVGHQVPRIAEFNYPWSNKSGLIMHSDGINTHWNMKSYPGLLNRDPALIAAVLYRDHSRQRDDATVLVAQPRAIDLRSE